MRGSEGQSSIDFSSKLWSIIVACTCGCQWEGGRLDRESWCTKPAQLLKLIDFYSGTDGIYRKIKYCTGHWHFNLFTMNRFRNGSVKFEAHSTCTCINKRVPSQGFKASFTRNVFCTVFLTI